MVKQDLTLRMYHEALGNKHVHYGLWNLGEELTLNNMRKAAQRFTDNLIGKIPQDVDSILDAGCGWGGTALQLASSGYDVTALSPDKIQAEHFSNLETQIPFVLSEFESFSSSKKFDLILMSESFNYIDINKGAQKSRELLTDKGYILAADYFLKPSDSDCAIRTSGYDFEYMLERMQSNQFELLDSEDITERVAPTLELAQQTYAEIARPLLRFVTETIKQKNPVTYWFASKLLNMSGKGHIEKMILNENNDSSKVIDPSKFREHKKYMVLLFQKK